MGSRDFKNSFYFGIVQLPSIPGMCQKLRLVKRPFKSSPRQCEDKYNRPLPNNFCFYVLKISSVVEFQRWWVLKCKIFAQESTCSKDFFFKNPTMNYGLSKRAEIILSKSRISEFFRKII